MGTVVVNPRPYGDALVPSMAQAEPDERFVVVEPGEELPGDADVLVTFLQEPDSVRELLAPQIRWVHVLATGVERFPFDALGSPPHTQVVTCSRGASAIPIAEWVLATMLAWEKQLPESWLSEPPERWNDASLGELRDKTLGLLGIGAIGVEVARRALVFGMRVLAVRRSAAPLPLPALEPADDVASLLARSDHVLVAAPATTATHHLVGAAALASAKPGVHLINVSRGSLVDQEALLEALDDGRVGRASLDVVDPEPLPAGHPLYRHPRVRLTPHISWSSPFTMPRTIQLFTDNLRRYRQGEPLAGVVDPGAGY